DCRLVAPALPATAERNRPWRHSARTGGALGQADCFLLRLWRTLGDGRPGRAGRRVENRMPHRRRHRCLEEGERTARSARCAIALRRAAHARASETSLYLLP